MLKAFLLAIVGVIGLSGASFAQSVAGSYYMSGTGSKGQNYGGQVDIRMLTDETCEIVWTYGTAGSYSSTCMVNRNVLTATYKVGDRPALIIFHVLEDGTMVGRWSVIGYKISGNEFLTPRRGN